MSDGRLTAYSQIVELVELERDLIAEGAWEELVRTGEQRVALTAALPPRPPAEARELLERAQAQLTANMAQVASARENAGAEITRIRGARQAFRGYAQPDVPRRLDLLR